MSVGQPGLRCPADQHTVGALTMYWRSVEAFDDPSARYEGLVLAAHLAVALAAAREIEQLSTAVASGTVIGQVDAPPSERVPR